MMFWVKFILLVLIIGQSAVGKFRSFGYRRFESATRTTKLDKAKPTESSLRTTVAPIENKTISYENSKTLPENSTFQQDVLGISNQTLTEALREVNTCKERNTSLARIRAGSGRNCNISVFHCNISKELIDELKDKLQQLEIFQGIIVLYPKNDSSNMSRSSDPVTQEKIKNHEESSSSQESSKNVMERAERDAILKNDIIESNIKVSQISHIYLGRSLYPFFTEESRIIDRDRTLPPPVYTEPAYTDDDKNSTL